MDTATGGGSADAAEVAVVDPLCPQRMNFDMIDLMSYEIIMDRRNRKERAGQLNVRFFFLFLLFPVIYDACVVKGVEVYWRLLGF